MSAIVGLDGPVPRLSISEGRAQEAAASTYLDEIYFRAMGLLEAEPRAPAVAAGLLAEAAAVGDARAMLALARIQMAGDGVPVDLDSAHELLVAAIAGGEEQAWSTLAELYRTEGPYLNRTREADALQQAVDLGDVRSMVRLAELVANGDGVDEDFERARSLLAGAIAADDPAIAPRAWGQLGALYAQSGNDPNSAAQAYEQAASLGHTPSMIALAEMLRNGEGVAADNARAIALLQQAAAADPEQAVRPLVALAELYVESPPPHGDAAKAAEAYQQAVDLGDVDSMIVLAGMLGLGQGVPVEFARAVALLGQASTDPSRAIRAWYTLGGLYRDAEPPNRDAAKAVEAFQRAADLGDPRSMVALARIVGFGDGVPVDAERALAALTKATAVADGGSASTLAWSVMGQLYQSAEPPLGDPAKAAEAYQHASDGGDPWSSISLARMTFAGEGVPRDFDRSVALLEKAIAAGGDAEQRAWRYLGDVYRDAAPPDGDPAKAVDAYQHAADMGDPWAMINVARLVGGSETLPLDFSRAESMLNRAISIGGDSELSAWATLGRLYRDAPEPWANTGKAADAFQRAADLGHVSSMIDLARLIKAGDGAPFDFQRARGLLEAAIASGEDSTGGAWAMLGDLYRDADPPDSDMAKAVDAYEQAARQGHAWSMLSVARLVGYGRGVPADFDRARKWLETAASYPGVGISASSSLAYLYLNAPDRSRRDPAKAADAFRHASDLGDTWSKIALAGMVAAGQGVSADPVRAAGLLRQAAAVDPDSDAAAEAWYQLGNLLNQSDGPIYDSAQAADAYRQGARLSEPRSMIRLGMMLAKGEGIPVDFARANALLTSAAAKGGDSAGDAWTALGDLYSNPAWERADEARAMRYYEIGAEAGVGRAHLAIAEKMIAGGEFSPQDRGIVIRRYIDAARTLDPESVGKAMFNASPALVYAAVQQMLLDTGYNPGSVDGVYGPQTRQSAGRFCAAHGIPSCGGEIVTLALLTGLLAAAAEN